MHGKLVGAVAALGVLGGVAAGAMADGERLFFVVSNDLSPSQPAATVTLWTAFDPRDYCFGATLTEARASEGVWSDPALIPPMTAAGTFPGSVSPDGSRVEGIIAGQFHWPRHGYGDPSNPIALWTARITIDDFTPRDIGLSTVTSRYEVYPDRESLLGRSAIATLTEAAATIAVVPAPGSLGVLGVALLAARRRRGAAGHRRPVTGHAWPPGAARPARTCVLPARVQPARVLHG